jgi:hypothetical protein
MATKTLKKPIDPGALIVTDRGAIEWPRNTVTRREERQIARRPLLRQRASTLGSAT